MPEQRPVSLSVAIVAYAPNLPVLGEVLRRLEVAVWRAEADGVLGETELVLVDNGPDVRLRDALKNATPSTPWNTVRWLEDHGNIGFGAGHNLALKVARGDFHLVLNPDVLLDEDALSRGLVFLMNHPQAGLLAPAVRDASGRVQYLCKRYPAVLDLLLRGFAPGWIRALFRKRLDHYEMRDRLGGEVVWDVPLVSGCCMLFRRPILDRAGGFSLAFFLYFEDFDLSLRVGRLARAVYVPAMRIVHFGGHAARKGRRHVRLFAAGAATFYGRHGWRWL